MNTKVFPFPEVVDRRDDGKPWVVAEGRGSVNIPDRVMSVPLYDKPNSRCVRAHEMAHTRWTPCEYAGKLAEKSEIHADTMQAVEDMRMNTMLTHCGVDMTAGFLDANVMQASLENELAHGDFRQTVLYTVASQGSGTYDALLAAFADHAVLKHAIAIATRMKTAMWSGDKDANGLPSFKATVYVAKLLDEMLTLAEEELKNPAKPEKGEAGGEGADLDEEDGAGGDESESGEDKAAKALEKAAHDVDLAMEAGGTKMVPWGKMTTETAPLMRQVSGFIGRKRVTSECGVVPRNIHRMPIDGRVFSNHRRERGGTVLIDWSGSMQLEVDQVRDILKAAPGCTVAAYSGNHSDGVLKIYAKRGKVCKDEHLTRPAGGGNVVDGPALRWLTNQSEPRIWVCDGQVTGVGDKGSTLNSLEAKRLTKKGRVKQALTAKNAVTLLTKLAR